MLLSDKAVRNMETWCSVLFMLSTMFLNHRSMSSCYRVSTRCLASELGLDNYPIPKVELRHHFTLMLIYTVGSLLAFANEIKALCTYRQHLEQQWYVVVADNNADFTTTALGYHLENSSLKEVGMILADQTFLFLMMAYTFAVLSLPELVISTFLHALGHALEDNLKRNSVVASSAPRFCRRVDQVAGAFNQLAKVFGNNMLLLIMLALIQLVWRAYFLITHLAFEDNGESFISDRRNIKGVLLCVVFIKRMFFLTNSVHKFDKRVGDTLDALSDMEATLERPEDVRAAARAWKRLEPLHGLNVRGFFIVDRTMFPALIGHFLTYIIILVQFRMSEDTG